MKLPCAVHGRVFIRPSVGTQTVRVEMPSVVLVGDIVCKFIKGVDFNEGWRDNCVLIGRGLTPNLRNALTMFSWLERCDSWIWGYLTWTHFGLWEFVLTSETFLQHTIFVVTWTYISIVGLLTLYNIFILMQRYTK